MEQKQPTLEELYKAYYNHNMQIGSHNAQIEQLSKARQGIIASIERLEICNSESNKVKEEIGKITKDKDVLQKGIKK